MNVTNNIRKQYCNSKFQKMINQWRRWYANRLFSWLYPKSSKCNMIVANLIGIMNKLQDGLCSWVSLHIHSFHTWQHAPEKWFCSLQQDDTVIHDQTNVSEQQNSLHRYLMPAYFQKYTDILLSQILHFSSLRKFESFHTKTDRISNQSGWVF